MLAEASAVEAGLPDRGRRSASPRWSRSMTSAWRACLTSVLVKHRSARRTRMAASAAAHILCRADPRNGRRLSLRSRRDHRSASRTARRFRLPSRRRADSISIRRATLAAVEAYQSMSEARPHRAALCQPAPRGNCGARCAPGALTATRSPPCSQPPVTAFRP